MSETATVSDIVSLSLGGESAGVKSAIGDVLQQKIMVALENKKKDVASTFLTKTRENYDIENIYTLVLKKKSPNRIS